MAMLFRCGFALAGRRVATFAVQSRSSVGRHRHGCHGQQTSFGADPLSASARYISTESHRDPYKTLGVDRNASADEIKKAYRREALKWHPDKNSPEKRKEAEQRFAAVASAYETLSDPEKKRQFDGGGFSSDSSGFSGGGFPSSGFGGSHSQESAERLFREVFGAANADQLLSELFGSMGEHAGHRGPKTLQVGMDVQIVLDHDSVRRASRASGIDATNDSMRARCTGKQGRIIKADPRDQTIKVRVDGVGDAWFGAQAVRPLATHATAGPGAAFRRPGAPFGAGDRASMMQMRQELIRKPDGSTVMRTIRTTRRPDGSTREDIMETPVR